MLRSKGGLVFRVNPSPAEPGYSLPLQTVWVDPDQLASEEANHQNLDQVI